MMTRWITHIHAVYYLDKWVNPVNIKTDNLILTIPSTEHGQQIFAKSARPFTAGIES